MENKGIPLISINDNSMKEHDKIKKVVFLGANNANTKMGHHVKGRRLWNHIYTSSNDSGASASAYASEDGGYTNLTGFSWPPPRLYVCSFCKREFRSAQALGGHMNVHKRDRARLRQSPPKELLLAGIGRPPVNNTVADYSNNLNFVPNPNPNLIQSSPSPLMIQKINTKTATYITDFSKIPSSSTCIISSPSRTHASGMMRWSAAKSNPLTTSAATSRTPNLYDANNNDEHLNNFQHVNINKQAWEKGGLLRMGFRTTASELRKEDAVDLELRLGYISS